MRIMYSLVWQVLFDGDDDIDDDYWDNDLNDDDAQLGAASSIGRRSTWECVTGPAGFFTGVSFIYQLS